MAIMSKQCIKENIEFDKKSLSRFDGAIRERIDQRIRIFEDVLTVYELKPEEVENYCREQISDFKAIAGMMIPLNRAEFIIDLYHEILNEEKEYNK